MYFASINQDCYALARPVSSKSCSLTTQAQTAVRAPNSKPTPPHKTACPELPLTEWLTPGAEFVYRPTGATWTEPRCPVAATHTVGRGANSTGTVKITMSSPCFTVARGKFQNQEVSYPSYIENAKALLDEEGEWFADFAAPKPTVLYKPRSTESLSTLNAVLGSAVHLGGSSAVATSVQVTGDVAAITLLPGTHHIAFQGLVISHLTWLRPSTRYGFVDLNFGFFFTGHHAQHANVPHSLHGVPGAMVMHGSRSITVTNCSFVNLGLSAIVTDSGSQKIKVIGSEFRDISVRHHTLGAFNRHRCRVYTDLSEKSEKRAGVK